MAGEVGVVKQIVEYTKGRRRLKTTTAFSHRLLSKQITVASCTGQRQHQHIILNPVGQKPIGQDVTFSMFDTVAGKRVIFYSFRRLSHVVGNLSLVKSVICKNFLQSINSNLSIKFLERTFLA